MREAHKQALSIQEGLVDALAEAAFSTMAALNQVGGEKSLSLTQLRVLGIPRDRRPRMATLEQMLDAHAE